MDGNVNRRDLTEVIAGKSGSRENQETVIDHLPSAVTCMRTVALEKRRYLVAGDEDGSVRVWDDS